MVIASVFHWSTAYVLAVVFGWKMLGVAIASSLQFCVRFLVLYTLLKNTKEFKKCIIPFSDPRSWEGLWEMHNLGVTTMILKVMGWWAFEILILMAAYL